MKGLQEEKGNLIDKINKKVFNEIKLVFSYNAKLHN